MDPGTGRMEARDLSEDHKPDGNKERARIEGGGGRVHPSMVPGRGFAGPARVWDPSQRFGLATSRSMGDTVYAGPNRSGVIAEPEVTCPAPSASRSRRVARQADCVTTV